MEDELKKSKEQSRSSELMSAVAATALRLLVGTACLAGYMKLNELFPISQISNEQFIAQHDWTYRMFYCFMVSLLPLLPLCPI